MSTPKSQAAVAQLELKKQQRKAFGTWRAIGFSYAAIATFNFFGMVLNFITSSFLYGIPQYLAFAVVVTLLVGVALKMKDEGLTRATNSDLASAYAYLSIGLFFILFQMVIGYLNQYWWFGNHSGTSLDIIMAIALRNEAPGMVRILAPGFNESRLSRSFLSRFGIVLLSLTALLPLLGGWLVGHVVTHVALSHIGSIAQLMGYLIPLVLFVGLVREIPNQTKPRYLTILTLLIVATLGFANGTITGAAPITGDTFITKSSVQVILYAMLATEVIAVLSLWYIFVLIPRFYLRQLAQVTAQ